MLPLDLLPQSWRSELDQEIIEPIRSGASGALVYRIQGTSGLTRFLKIAVGRYVEDLSREIERTKWLHAVQINVPMILKASAQAEVAAVLMSAVGGQPAEDCRESPADVISVLAKGVAQFHALPIDSCPYDESVSARLARARADIASGRVDSRGFDSRNLGISPQKLFDRLLWAATSVREDLVVVHGDATFSNILVDSTGRVGFVDCGHCGKADRYVDLALVCAEIEGQFGGQWIASFLEAYGLGLSMLDPLKARFFLDLYELF